MIKLHSYECNYYDYVKENEKPILVYGLGDAVRRYHGYFGNNISYYCDSKSELKEYNGVKVIKPAEINKYISDCIVLVCVADDRKIPELVAGLFEKLGVDADIFDFFNNSAFNVYHKQFSYCKKQEEKPLRVRLVLYDESGWILTKFAKRMEENLRILGCDVDIASTVDVNADINHHISHHLFEPVMDCNDTLMITHYLDREVLEKIRHQVKCARMAVCMSRQTMEALAADGIPRHKLCYINPAHDGVVKKKKYVLGITHKNHSGIDCRKNINAIVEICKRISPDYFSFLIMGAGWEDTINKMDEMGFDIEYYNDFDYDLYMNEVIPSMDYYLFYGYDEGSMGFLDALAAGVKTIVTPQGYHLDYRNGITYACKTVDDFVEVLLDIQREREKLVKSVENHTWYEYSRKHLEVWNYILAREDFSELMSNKHMYLDGIYSVRTDII